MADITHVKKHHTITEAGVVMYASYEGPSMAVEEVVQPFDVYCPECGGNEKTMNYWLVKCLARQSDRSQKTCYGGCRAVAIAEQRKRRAETSRYCTRERSETRGKVYAYIKQGLSNAEIAKLLERSKSTIRSYRSDYNNGR